MNVASPCIHVCQLDGREVCLGCYRTRGEIARWTQMMDGEKIRVISLLPGRRPVTPECRQELSAHE